MELDEDRLNRLLQRVIEDIGATFHAPLVLIGEELNLFSTLAGSEPMAPAELAEATGTAERYIGEWLPSMAAGGYVTYDPETQRYSMSKEQAFVLADRTSPAYLPGAFQAVTAAIKSAPKLIDAFRTGAGVGWEEHDPEFYHGAERFYRPHYIANLVSAWIPALEGVEQMLQQGARVADVGCGYGTSTILMAQAYPRSTFVGVDFHEPSIESARRRAVEAGVSDRVVFVAESAKKMSGAGYDLIMSLDCLHDMGDPEGVSRRMYEALNRDGSWMIVEPFAGDRVEDNLNPVGRLFYCASVLLCTPGALDQEGVLALGGQAGEARLREVVTGGGFTRFRRVAETQMNIVYEAKR